MFTRSQYIKGECSHREYYAQFVSDDIIHAVMRHFTIPRIVGSRDPHFNDIPLRAWDCLAGCSKPLLAIRSEHDGKRYYGLCEAICILKEAAEQIREQHNASR